MTFNATCEETKTHTIKRGDPSFMIQGKFTITPRAGILVNTNCPKEYVNIIQHCLQKGWIETVATITEREKIFMGLTNDQ